MKGFKTILRDIFGGGSGSEAARKVAEATHEGVKSIIPSSSDDGRKHVTTERGLLSIATANRCVNVYADAVATMPLNILRKSGTVYCVDESNPLHYLLTVEPNPAQSAHDFWKRVIPQLFLHGNAYIIPKRDGAKIYAFYVVNSAAVSHDINLDTYYIYDIETGISGYFEEWEIIHLKLLTENGKHGVGIITHARQTLSHAATAEESAIVSSTPGGTTRGFISGDSAGAAGFSEYSDEELKRVSERYEVDIKTGRRIMVLPGSLRYNPMGWSAADQQFLQNRQFSLKDICRFFSVPPSYVYDDSSQNYKSAEMAETAFLNNSLNPLLRMIETEFQRKLIPRELSGKMVFRFDRESRYSLDLNTKINYYTKMVAGGFSSINQIRQKENIPPVEKGDTVLVSANLKTLDALINENSETNP